MFGQRHLEHIAVDHRDIHPIGVLVSERAGEVIIEFYQHEVRHTPGKMAGQRSATRADLDYLVARLRLNRVHDLPLKVTVDEEVLAERSLWSTGGAR
jgi:hypothetical protein